MTGSRTSWKTWEFNDKTFHLHFNVQDVSINQFITHTHTHIYINKVSSVPMAEVGRIHCQPFFTTCLLQCVNITLPTNNMCNSFQAFKITSYHLFMAFSISMVTSTDRAMVMGWGSLKTRQSTPLNSSPSPMQARWWVCKKSISTPNFSALWKLQHEWQTCS